jgi:hypothetical protein
MMRLPMLLFLVFLSSACRTEGIMSCFSDDSIEFARQFAQWTVAAVKLEEARESGVGRGQRVFLSGATLSAAPVDLGPTFQVNSPGSAQGLEVGGTYILLLAGIQADPVPWHLVESIQTTEGESIAMASRCREEITASL